MWAHENSAKWGGLICCTVEFASIGSIALEKCMGHYMHWYFMHAINVLFHTKYALLALNPLKSSK